MIKILILAQSPQSILANIDRLGLPNLHVMDESSFRSNTGFDLDPDWPGYRDMVVERMSTLVRAWKAARPLAIVLDMRYHTAIEKIPHDTSCLVYDGSQQRRLAYNTSYKTDLTIGNIGEIFRLTERLSMLL